MANPRAEVGFEGLDGKYRTYFHDGSIVYDSTKPDGSISVGLAVSLKSHRTVGLAADAEPLEGKLLKVEADGKCSVQTGGCTSLPPGTGAAVTVGKKAVGDLLVAAPGYIREVASDAEAAAGKTRIISGLDAAAIVVDLG